MKAYHCVQSILKVRKARKQAPTFTAEQGNDYLRPFA